MEESQSPACQGLYTAPRGRIMCMSGSRGKSKAEQECGTKVHSRTCTPRSFRTAVSQTGFCATQVEAGCTSHFRLRFVA